MKLPLLTLLSTFAFQQLSAIKPNNFKTSATGSIAFSENKGQVHDQYYKPRPDVLFGAMTGNMAFHLKTNGVSYQLYRVDKWKEAKHALQTESVEPAKRLRKEISQQTIYRIDLNWLNHNTNFLVSKDEVLSGHNNYYLENCPKGALNVKSYSGVTLYNLFNGINLHYYEKNGELKHDYIVAPHADYKKIQIEVKGATVIMNKDGSLLLTTPLGEVQEGAPIVYQNNRQLKARWTVRNNILGFEIEKHNPNLELIIDPLTRAWGTFYGGSGQDFGQSCSTDASNNVYLAGYVDALNTGTMIATLGSHQATFGGGPGNIDSYIAKFNSSGVRLWGTYYGGLGLDYGKSCCTDANGYVYLAGTTGSGNAIATVGSHQQIASGVGSDAFLAKFDGNGVRQWATYYGDNNIEEGTYCTTDAIGNVYMTGFSTSMGSSTFIATTGCHQPTNGGATDAFLVKFNSNGVRQWGTFYGGNDQEVGRSLSVDGNGNVFIAGQARTSTGTAIATPGSHQSIFGGGIFEAFLAKFNSNGVRQWGTYYGGTGQETAWSCCADAIGNVYLAGYTSTTGGTVIATVGSHQSNNGGGGIPNDAFLAKFNGSGVRQWATYYGGTGSENANSCVLDAIGNVYLAGETSTPSGTAIATANSHQTTLSSNITSDAFLAKFNSSGIRQSGTYYGGLGTEYGRCCSIDAAGNLYLAGETSSNGTSIATPGSHQPSLILNGYSSYLAKFNECNSINLSASVNSVACIGASLNFSASATSTAVLTYSWSGPASFTANTQNPSIPIAGTINIGTYTLSVNSGTGCVETVITQVNTIVSLNPSAAVNSVVCSGSSLNFTANTTGTNIPTYSWSGPASFASSIQNPSISTASALNIGTYTLTVTNNGCVETTTTQVNSILPSPTVTAVSNNSTQICSGKTVSLTANGASSYSWSTNANTPVILVTPTITTSYTVTGTNTNGCTAKAVVTQSVKVCTSINDNERIANIIVYPNPSTGLFNVQNNTGETITISIVNPLGQLILVKNISESGIIDLSNFSKGVYYMRAGDKIEKLLKE